MASYFTPICFYATNVQLLPDREIHDRSYTPNLEGDIPGSCYGVFCQIILLNYQG
jgi:hypothetical protein